jgi:hypothetical protein
MKKRIFLFIFFSTIFISSNLAQSVITSSSFPENGITLKYSIGTAKTFLDLSGGREKIWDLSAISPEPASEITYSNIENINEAALFSESNIAFAPATAPGDFTFLKFNNEMVEYLGFVSDFKGDLYVAKYNDPWIWYSLPLKFNNTFSDTYACHSRLINGGDTIDYFSSGLYSYTVDGYGTLITPSKTIPNTLRVNATISGIDSAVYRNKKDSSSVIRHNTNKVSWLSSETGNYFELASTFDFKDFFFAESSNKNAGIASLRINNLSLFPDPAITAINIDLRPIGKGQVEITLFNNFGNIIKVFHCDLSGANSGNWNLPVQDLPAGLYYVRVKGSKQDWGAKFIKQ